jgi:hypothetical protein
VNQFGIALPAHLFQDAGAAGADGLDALRQVRGDLKNRFAYKPIRHQANRASQHQRKIVCCSTQLSIGAFSL